LVFDRNGIDLPDLEQALAPIEDRRVEAMPLGALRWVRLDLMPAARHKTIYCSIILTSRASSAGLDFVGD
jgi:hypothetical protein